MAAQLQQTREAWLNYVVQRMAPMFEKLGAPATAAVAYRDWIYLKRPAQQLVGQMAATTAGSEFDKAMRPILEAAGPLPHGRLQLAIGASSHSNRRKKPSSRPIKSACSNCGYTVHTTRKRLELAGAPLCPIKWTRRRCNLPRLCNGITASALVRVGHES